MLSFNVTWAVLYDKNEFTYQHVYKEMALK